MRDRGKRRKQQPEKQGQEQPAPLQPKFPEPVSDDIGNRIEQPITRRQPQLLPSQILRIPSPPPRLEAGKSLRGAFAAIATAAGDAADVVDDREAATQVPSLPGPGGPTGEAAEAESAGDVNRTGCRCRTSPGSA